MNEPLKTVIIGAGPVGLATACILKSIDPKASITVLDKREDTTRNHGLHIDTDTVSKMTRILDAHLKQHHGDKGRIKELRSTFASWADRVVRTKKIEGDLTEIARKLGVIVLRTEDVDFEKAMKEKPTFQNDEYSVQACIQKADMVVGADGSHSLVRSHFMKEEQPQRTPLSHLIEFKFNTESSTKPRGWWETIKHAFSSGSIDFETMGKTGDGADKPGTLHISVDKETYDLIRTGDSKGTFQNPWAIDEIARSENPKVKAINRIIEDYVKRMGERGATCRDGKITCIPMEVYKSQKVVVKNDRQYVMLAGDASAGVVFGRGVNKGFQEAVLCAKAIRKFALEKTAPQQSVLPESLSKYSFKHEKLYQSEALTAKLKGIAIRIGCAFVSGISKFLSLFSKKS